MIVYSAVARASDCAVLAESTSQGVGGNAPQATRSLLDFLRTSPTSVPEGTRKTFAQHNDAEQGFGGFFSTSAFGSFGQTTDVDHYFHAYKKDGVIYMSLTDDGADTRRTAVVFQFLDEVRDMFTKQYSAKRIAKANAYGFEKAFSPKLGSLAHNYNTGGESMGRSDKVNERLAQVEDLKSVMGRNINVMLTRGERIDGLMERSEALEAETHVFRKQSKDLKNIMWRRHFQHVIILVLFVAGLVYLLSASICGFNFSRCSVKRD